MKNRIHKIMGVGIALVIAMALVMGFAAPAAANPGETINEWYEFDYPAEGEDGDWFYDPTIGSVGPVAEAINGDLYTAVSFGQDEEFSFEMDGEPGWMYIEPIPGGYNDAIIWAEIYGDFDLFDHEEPYEFVNFSARWCYTDEPFDGGFLEGWEYACGSIIEGDGDDNDLLIYQGYIVGNFIELEDLYVSEAFFHITPNGKLRGYWEFFGEFEVNFCGSYSLGGSLMKSTDGGRTWEKTGYEDVEYEIEEPGDGEAYVGAPGPVVDMVCSSIDEDTIYVTDGHYVYKSTDGGDEFTCLARDSLEEMLEGECGYPIIYCPITSIDVAYDDDDNPFVFIGTRPHYSWYLDELVEGDVYYIGEAGYPANWTSLNLPCFHGGGYEALAIGCAPDWAESKETYVVVSGTGLRTFVIYTKGTVCGWYEFAELLWDCDVQFGSFLSSRIGFPDDWEDTETLFVGVVDEFPCVADDIYPFDTDEQGGDVYMATDGSAIDMNVAGIVTGCVGEESVDIISLDIEGDTDEARLIAGAFCDTNVYCSEDGGWSWDVSDKDPTGSWATYVLWYEDTAVAATSCCECAFSMCCGEDYPCEFWDQISLISTDIEYVQYIDHSPGYVCGDSETMFMLTECEGHCCFICDCDPWRTPAASWEDTYSLFRYDGTYWERVYCSTLADFDLNARWNRVRVSPDFNETNCVYLVNGRHEIWRTTDAGCSWDKLTFPCAPRPCMRNFVVIDEDTVITGGRSDGPDCEDSAGYVYKTTRHGARPWDEYEFDDTHEGDVISFALEPGYEDPGSILLGDDESRVYISEDGGETWELVGDCEDVLEEEEDTYVIFDPSYPSNPFIYAAAGYTIARCEVDFDEDWADQTWELICDGIVGYAAGIAAAGDTALYVIDDNVTSCAGGCCIEDVPDNGGVLRSLNPDADDADDVIFERLAEGLPYYAAGLHDLWLTCDTSEEGCDENVLWALDSYDCDNIWVWEDTLAAPVTLTKPLDEQKLGETDSATLGWNELCGADCYEVSLWKYCAECPDEKMDVTLDFLDCAPGACCIACAPDAAMDICACEVGECTCTEDTCIVIEDLEPGTTYHWQVRVCQCQPFLSKWSEERTFTTALLGVPFEGLSSPACGDTDIILTPNFTWGPVDGATGYDIEIATTETFTAGVIRGSSTVNAWVCPEELDYSTTYYWRVRAKKDGVYSDWMICMFTTMAEPEEPPPPVEIQEAPPAPQINIPPAKMVTPNWIYAIVAIGAVLCIVVIVLIVRTRRPPA